HALERSSRVGGVVVRAYRLPGRFSKPLACPFSMGVGVFYLQQRRALDYAKFPVRNAPAGVNEIKGLANQKISDPSNAEDLALAIQIVLHGKERPPCDGLFRLPLLLLFAFCHCLEALALEDDLCIHTNICVGRTPRYERVIRCVCSDGGIPVVRSASLEEEPALRDRIARGIYPVELWSWKTTKRNRVRLPQIIAILCAGVNKSAVRCVEQIGCPGLMRIRGHGVRRNGGGR